jgi:hypothetical protein
MRCRMYNSYARITESMLLKWSCVPGWWKEFLHKNHRFDAVEVIMCTWWTTRELTGCAPKLDSSSYTLQWVVASSPLRRPAAPSNSDPVQTEVVYRLVSCTYTKPSINHRLSKTLQKKEDWEGSRWERMWLHGSPSSDSTYSSLSHAEIDILYMLFLSLDILVHIHSISNPNPSINSQIRPPIEIWK